MYNKYLGWERNTYGYHGDDGYLFRGSGQGRSYGPTFSTGDIVGCCVNFISGTLFFTKNGIPLGTILLLLASGPWIHCYGVGEAANDIKGTYYPCVGLRTPGEIVEVNFGQKNFSYDYEQYLRV